MIRKTCHFSGRVQGVGFRYTVQSIARGFRVAGFVQNLSDGRVKLVVEGETGDIDGFIEAIGCEMRGFIRSIDQVTEPVTNEFAGFSIRH